MKPANRAHLIGELDDNNKKAWVLSLAESRSLPARAVERSELVRGPGRPPGNGRFAEAPAGIQG